MTNSPACHLVCGLMIALAAGRAHGASLTLNCSDPFFEDKPEAARIHQKAKGIVSRKGAQLTIKLAARTIVMKNVKAEEDEMSDSDYRFCDRKDGLILIAVLEDGDSSGTLIDEATGKMSPAGVPTIFSHDRKLMFKQTHPEGLDGEDWTVYREGKQIWTGRDSFPTKSVTDTYVPFSNPAFNDQGQLTATAQCTSNPDVQWPIVLDIKGKRGSWSPRRQCPQASD